MTYILSDKPEVLDNLIRELKSLNPHVKHIVTIKKYKKNLTSNQRNYWHKLIKIIAEDRGDCPEKLKTDIKLRVLEPIIAKKDGVDVLVLPSSEGLTRDQYSELIAATKELGYFLQIQLPEPKHFGYE